MITYKLPNCDVEVLIDKGSPSYMNENELYPVSDYPKMSIVMKSAPWHWKIQGKLIPITNNLLASDKSMDLVDYVKQRESYEGYLKGFIGNLENDNVGLRKIISELKEENARLTESHLILDNVGLKMDPLKMYRKVLSDTIKEVGIGRVFAYVKHEHDLDSVKKVEEWKESMKKKTVSWAENGDGSCRCLSCNQAFTGDVLAHDCQNYGKAWVDENESISHASPSKLKIEQPNSPEKQETWRDRSPLL